MSTGAATQPTVRSLDSRLEQVDERLVRVETRIDSVDAQFKTFRTRVEFLISFLKWVGALVATTLIAVILQLLTVSFSAGKLHQKVDDSEAAIQELRKDMGALKTELRADMAALKTELRSDMQEIRTELRELGREMSKPKPPE